MDGKVADLLLAVRADEAVARSRLQPRSHNLLNIFGRQRAALADQASPPATADSQSPATPKARLLGSRGYLGTVDLLRAERMAVRAWGLPEEANGHCLGRWDLFRQWSLVVSRRVAVLQAAEGELSDSNQKVEARTQLVSDKTMQARRQGQRQRRARRAMAKAAAEQPGLDQPLLAEPTGAAGQSYLQKGPGSTSAARWHITLIAKQVVEHYFDDSRAPAGTLTISVTLVLIYM